MRLSKIKFCTAGGLEAVLRSSWDRGMCCAAASCFCPPPQVFILGRMGNTTQALHLIIDRLGDIPQVWSQCVTVLLFPCP
jgi:hypothetical protein